MVTREKQQFIQSNGIVEGNFLTMKRITTMVISVLALALFATGCASAAQVAAGC